MQFTRQPCFSKILSDEPFLIPETLFLEKCFYLTYKCLLHQWLSLFSRRFDEVCKYTFGKQGPQAGTNHFTQLVWKGSTELGIGKATNKRSNGATCTFIVARYKPQGNFDNDDNAYTKNVDKGSFDASYCNSLKKAGLDGGYGFKRFQGTQCVCIY